MSAPDGLGEVWRTYQVTVDCLKVTLHSIKRKRLDALQDTGFVDNSVDVVRNNIQISREAVNDHTILSMWAVFEREMVAILESESRKLLGETPCPFSEALFRKVEAGIEYWRVSEMIDLFKPVLAVELVGYTKQVKQYRDWVAHKNPKKPPSAKVTPEFAYEILAEALAQMRSVLPNPGNRV
jgi:hypothetical protein